MAVHPYWRNERRLYCRGNGFYGGKCAFFAGPCGMDRAGCDRAGVGITYCETVQAEGCKANHCAVAAGNHVYLIELNLQLL